MSMLLIEFAMDILSGTIIFLITQILKLLGVNASNREQAK